MKNKVMIEMRRLPISIIGKIFNANAAKGKSRKVLPLISISRKPIAANAAKAKKESAAPLNYFMSFPL